MSHPLLPLHFPQASNSTLLGLAGAFVALIAAAVSWDYIRKRLRHRRIIQSEWNMVRDLFRERALDAPQQDLLISMLNRYAPHSPLSALTVRRQFDVLVDQFMREALNKKTPEQFRELGKTLRELRVRLNLDYVAYGHSIQSTRELRTGQILWLAAGGDSDYLMAKVAATDDAYLGVALRNPEARFPLRPGEKARFRLWREDDGRYHFESVLAVAPHDAPPIWSFHHTSQLQRIQERCFYRVRCSIDTHIERVDEPPADLEELRLIPVNVCSLSAGGFAAVSRCPFKPDVQIRLFLNLPGEPPLVISARTIAGSGLGGGRYIIRGQFLGAYQEAKDVIARYVARRQQPVPAEPSAVETP